MKRIISLTAAVCLFVCFMAGCGMVENGGKAVEEGAQKVEDGASSLLNEEKDMIQRDGVNNDSSARAN